MAKICKTLMFCELLFLNDSKIKIITWMIFIIITVMHLPTFVQSPYLSIGKFYGNLGTLMTMRHMILNPVWVEM